MISLRLHEDNEGAAAVGVDETTEELAPYPYPRNEKIKFWDLPGFGMYTINVNLTQVIVGIITNVNLDSVRIILY